MDGGAGEVGRMHAGEVGRMHADEVAVGEGLVRRLLAAQLPHLEDRPLRRVASGGTVNALYRLGDDLVVRLPLTARVEGQVAKEHEWLPRLAPHLPLAVPVPVALGEPGEGYPWHWSVFEWLPGDNADLDRIADRRAAAADLAAFVAGLRALDPAGAPAPGEHNFWRGVPLAERDAEVRESVAALAGDYDPAALTRAWEAALRAPEHAGPPVWLHGDLQAGNLLTRDGRLAAVIDFGGLGAGDPACDVMAAWTYLTAAERDVFRAALGTDDATWARARGWALSVALIALPYYRVTNTAMAAFARRVVAEVLADPS